MEKTYFEYLRRKWQQARRCELCRFYVPHGGDWGQMPSPRGHAAMGES